MTKASVPLTIPQALTLLAVLRQIRAENPRVGPEFGYALQRNLETLEPVERAFQAGLSGEGDAVVKQHEPIRQDILRRRLIAGGASGAAGGASEAAEAEWQAHIQGHPDLAAAFAARMERARALEAAPAEAVDLRRLPIASFPPELAASLWASLALLVEE